MHIFIVTVFGYLDGIVFNVCKCYLCVTNGNNFLGGNEVLPTFIRLNKKWMIKFLEMNETIIDR